MKNEDNQADELRQRAEAMTLEDAAQLSGDMQRQKRLGPSWLCRSRDRSTQSCPARSHWRD